jgi:hypothetical protein
MIDKNNKGVIGYKNVLYEVSICLCLKRKINIPATVKKVKRFKVKPT